MRVSTQRGEGECPCYDLEVSTHLWPSLLLFFNEYDFLVFEHLLWLRFLGTEAKGATVLILGEFISWRAGAGYSQRREPGMEKTVR